MRAGTPRRSEHGRGQLGAGWRGSLGSAASGCHRSASRSSKSFIVDAAGWAPAAAAVVRRAGTLSPPALRRAHGCRAPTGPHAGGGPRPLPRERSRRPGTRCNCPPAVARRQPARPAARGARSPRPGPPAGCAPSRPPPSEFHSARAHRSDPGPPGRDQRPGHAGDRPDLAAGIGWTKSTTGPANGAPTPVSWLAASVLRRRWGLAAGAAPGWPKSKRVPANETCRDGPDRTGTRRRAPIRCSSSGNSIHTPVSSASAGGTSTRSPSVVSSAGGNATARSRPPGFRPTARTRGGRRRPGGRPGDRCRCARWGSGTWGSACPDSDVPPDRGRQ